MVGFQNVEMLVLQFAVMTWLMTCFSVCAIIVNRGEWL